MATWTPTENAKIIGILPNYRTLKKRNNSQMKTAIYLARIIIQQNRTVFTVRRRAKNPVNTVAQHIVRMDKIASGKVKPRYADEFNWANCYKY